MGLQSLVRVADEELLGSWASITADLISFCRSKGRGVYSEIADALDSMADIPVTDDDRPDPPGARPNTARRPSPGNRCHDGSLLKSTRYL